MSRRLILFSLVLLFFYFLPFQDYSEEVICITETEWMNCLQLIEDLKLECQMLRMLLIDLLKSNQKLMPDILLKYENLLNNQKKIVESLKQQIKNLQSTSEERQKEYNQALIDLDQLKKDLKISEKLLEDLKKNNLIRDLKIAGTAFSLGVIITLIVQAIIKGLTK